MDINKMRADAEKLTMDERAIIIFEYVVNGLSTRAIEKKCLGLENRKGWIAWGVLQAYEIKKDSKGKYSNTTFASIKIIIESVSFKEVSKTLENLKNNQ
jgi:hypothetical protein